MRNDPARLPPLDLLVSFEAVARLLSITRAAAERFITQSAMSRQISALEADIGVALFTRRHRALELTPAGVQLQQVCVRLLDGLHEAMAQLRAPPVREVLSLTTTPSFASLWLIPRLVDFTRDHPGIDVRLDASFERRDLRHEGFDLAVRYGTVGAMQGEPLFGESIVAVCSPSLRRRGAPPLRSPADLARHTLLDVNPPPRGGMPTDWGSWLRMQRLEGLTPAATLTLSSYNEAMAAAVAGQGVALGRRPLIDHLLAQGQLVELFGRAAAGSRGYSLVLEPIAARRPAVQALAAWLQQQAAAAL